MTDLRKPFSIETYSPEKQYETRDGRSARVLCVDSRNHNFPVVALLDNDAPQMFGVGGKFLANGEQHHLDLFESPQPDDWAAKAQADRDAAERKRRRDMFAAAALPGLLASPKRAGDLVHYAIDAVALADAMLAALDGGSK